MDIRLKQVTFFRKLSFQLVPEMRLLFRGGKLWKRDGWRNVAEHCLVQAAAAQVLASLLRLPKADAEKLVNTAACHDWAKRLTIKPQEFVADERWRAQELQSRVGLDPSLLHATGPEFLEVALVQRTSTFLQHLQFYLDDICKGSEIVRFLERVAEVEARRQDLNEDLELARRLGGRYWDKERELGQAVELEICTRLRNQDIYLDSPDEVPALLLRELKARIEQTR